VPFYAFLCLYTPLTNFLKLFFTRNQERLMYIIEANILEGTAMRELALTDVQFGEFFSQPQKVKTWMADQAVSIYTSVPLFKKYTSPELTDSQMRDAFLTFLEPQDEILILKSVGGVSRPDDCTSSLYTSFRQATQRCWEEFVPSVTSDAVDPNMQS
jgi:hypothetical protein